MIRQLLLFGLVVWGIIYSYNRLTDGYSLSQMRSELPNNPRFAPPDLSLDEEDKIRAMLDQPFHYLGKGCQFYAFASADGKYVLKFLKQKHLRAPPPFQKGSAVRRQERVEKLFSSVQLAYQKLPVESGLLYIHLNRMPAIGSKVTLVDKMGIKRKILIDDYEFILQERALTVKEVFEKINSQEEAEARIDQLVALVHARCAKGIRDRDRSFAQNVAFAQNEDRALFIDVGQFYEDETILQKEEQEIDLQKRLGNLNHFLEKIGYLTHHHRHHHQD